MSLNNVDLSLPDNFDNTVKLFPLPNLVLFPGVIQALHIFETRYRELMSDALSSDSLITMALIEPGWKSQFVDEPELFPTVCIGKVMTHAKLEDGRFNLLLMGVRRARIVRELDEGTAYRSAEVEICRDHLGCSQQTAQALKVKVVKQFRDLAARRPQVDQESLEELLREDLSLGQIVDLISYSSGMPPVEQQRILAATDVSIRAELLLEILDQDDGSFDDGTTSQQHGFPPDFSLN